MLSSSFNHHSPWNVKPPIASDAIPNHSLLHDFLPGRGAVISTHTHICIAHTPFLSPSSRKKTERVLPGGRTPAPHRLRPPLAKPRQPRVAPRHAESRRPKKASNRSRNRRLLLHLRLRPPAEIVVSGHLRLPPASQRCPIVSW
jgi:hypothetical protein